MRILFLFLIQFYSQEASNTTIIINETPLNDISSPVEDALVPSIIWQVGEEDEYENSKGQNSSVALPRLDHGGYHGRFASAKNQFARIIRKYIVYLNLRT
ncbi:hypothetical protein [Ohtaekwangia koreensis]|uniref:Uncharacterized protein n=1 Tax=Ohtaekwangia koreensis TaxID=688867 RepID=A0A1T5MLZ7_9BACT|nr:hypothetical protein [Ohtaekwangia koreensis]SKC89242.1 hypothetical protein SAMN05660236_5802 [Ohtaekwangia koreensis]